MDKDKIQIVELTKDCIIDVIIEGARYPRSLPAGFKGAVLLEDYFPISIHSDPKEYLVDIDFYFSIDKSIDPEKMTLKGRIQAIMIKPIFKTDKEAV